MSGDGLNRGRETSVWRLRRTEIGDRVNLVGSSTLERVDMALVEARGVAGGGSRCSDGGSILMGRGKRDFFLFRRGSLKRVVVVEMVCVVVVVA